MTVTSSTPLGLPAEPPIDLVTVTVDDIDVSVPKGTLIIRAAELVGIEIPRFCDHPLLEPVAACRQCLVEIEGQGKPQPSCAVSVADGMRVRTQLTSSMADEAQRGIMEFLLINHPLDCPICDKGGECPLQNQAMSNGRGETRFHGPKRTFVKPVAISAQVLLDRERCVSCARCTRFAEQIAGDPFIELLERGSNQQVGIGPDVPFNSYFSGNTIQICPVGALTSARYRFRSRPFDLVSVPTMCEHCASGCALRTDYRRTTVMRRQAWDDPSVNEEWNCDKGRFAFPYLTRDRITRPLVRVDGELRPVSWPEALGIAAAGLSAAAGRVGVLPGGRLTYEDALAYAQFAKGVLGTDDVDFRARPASVEETEFLAAQVAGAPLGPTYADLEAAPFVLLAGLEPEDESPIVFLRLRKAVRRSRQLVASIAPYASYGLTKLSGLLVPTAPGAEAAALTGLLGSTGESDTVSARISAGLSEPGAVILVGERLATSPGALRAVVDLARATGAALGWIPRRAGERGAVEAGLLPGLLPGGRDLSDVADRAEVAAVWGVPLAALPAQPGRDLAGLVEAILGHRGEPDPEVVAPVGALVVGGIEPVDVADPAGLRAALDAVGFVVSLETRHSEVTDRADVVLPAAVVTEKAGTYLDWEGRSREFGAVFRDSLALPDGRVLAMLADALDQPVGRGDVASARAIGARLGVRPRESMADAAIEATTETTTQLSETTTVSAAGFQAARLQASNESARSESARSEPARSESGLLESGLLGPGPGQALLATWRELLDLGVMQEGEPHLAATARPAVARVSAATASEVGLAEGALLAVSTDAGFITLPVRFEEMPDRVVWLPTHSAGCTPADTLGVGSGALVRLTRGSAT